MNSLFLIIDLAVIVSMTPLAIFLWKKSVVRFVLTYYPELKENQNGKAIVSHLFPAIQENIRRRDRFPVIGVWMFAGYAGAIAVAMLLLPFHLLFYFSIRH